MPGPRWLHRAYALAAGFFWRPCPICGRMFGGHEWDGENRWHYGPPTILAGGIGFAQHAVGVCSSDCAIEARLREQLGIYADERSTHSELHAAPRITPEGS